MHDRGGGNTVPHDSASCSAHPEELDGQETACGTAGAALSARATGYAYPGFAVARRASQGDQVQSKGFGEIIGRIVAYYPMYGSCPYDPSTEGIMSTAAVSMRKQAAPKARERIDIRLRPEQKAEIEKAAHIKGLTITDFIIQNAVTNAKQAIREYETWSLERPDAEIFAAALMEPAVLGPKLTQVARRYKERFLK